MRLALWATLAVLGGPLPLISLTELSLLVCDRFLQGSGALPLLVLGTVTLWNTPIPPLPFLLLFLSLLFFALSHALPTRVPLSSLQPLALIAALAPLLRNPSLSPLLFAAPLLLLVAAQRSKRSAGPSEEAWLASALLSLVLSFATRAHLLRAAADGAIALGVLAALLSLTPSPPRLLASVASQPLQIGAPPMVIALLYALLSSPYSSLAPLLPFHGFVRVVITLLTASLLLASTLYRRFLPHRFRAPLLISACGLVGFMAAQGLHGLALGATSAALLVLGPPRSAPLRVPTSALIAALLMLLLSHRAAPHLPSSTLVALGAAFFLSLLSAAWLTAPRLAPKSPAFLASLPPALLGLLYTFLESHLGELLPVWTRVLTWLLLSALALRLPSTSACLLFSTVVTNAALFFLTAPAPLTSVILLLLLPASLLFPIYFRPSTRSHFFASIGAALFAALLCALFVVPSHVRLHALLASPLAAAPSLWAWHHSLLHVAPLPLPLCAFLLFSANLLGPFDTLFLGAALALASTRPQDAATLAGAAAGSFVCHPAPLRLSLAAAGCAALWTRVLTGAPIALLAEVALAALLALLTSAAPLLRPLLYLRVLFGAAAVHLAALILAPPSAASMTGPLSLSPSVLAPLALALTFAALRLVLNSLSASLLASLLTPLLLLAPPLPFLAGRYSLAVACTTVALLLGTLPSLIYGQLLEIIAALCALAGAVSLAQATRLLAGARSRAAAEWLIPIPVQVFAIVVGSLEARLLAALSLVASVWLAVHGHQRHQKDLATL